MEIFWLAITILGALAAIYLLITHDNYKMILYCLGVSVIAGFKYYWRRRQRIVSNEQTGKR